MVLFLPVIVPTWLLVEVERRWFPHLPMKIVIPASLIFFFLLTGADVATFDTGIYWMFGAYYVPAGIWSRRHQKPPRQAPQGTIGPASRAFQSPGSVGPPYVPPRAQTVDSVVKGTIGPASRAFQPRRSEDLWLTTDDRP
ncbi:MAG: hypothetical protein AB7N24_17030 [Dehalococcoidia bacterium]